MVDTRVLTSAKTLPGGMLNILAYGAVNGADCTAALQAAIDALPDEGGTVFIPVGQWFITGPVTTDKFGVRLIGAGSYTYNEAFVDQVGSTLVLDGATATIEFAPSALKHVGPIIENINFLAADEDQSQDAVLIRLMNHWAVRDCGFRGFARCLVIDSAGVLEGGDASWGQVEQCVFMDSNYGVVSADLTGSGDGPSFLVTGGDFTCHTAGIYLGNRTPQCRIIGVKFDCVGGIGVHSKGYTNAIIGNTFEACDPAIKIERDGSGHTFSGHDHRIIGNNFTGREGDEDGVLIGSSCARTQLMGNSWVNLDNDFLDSGDNTVCVDALRFYYNVTNGRLEVPDTAGFQDRFKVFGAGVSTYIDLINSNANGGDSWRLASDQWGNLQVLNLDTSMLMEVKPQGFIRIPEAPYDPGDAPANSGLIYMRDNGSGKTQFVAKFPSGAVQVLATEP